MKKKGFTLVELLAVIVVLGIIMIFAIPGVMRQLKKGSTTYYNSLENDVKVAGVDYMQTYRALLPREIGNAKTIEIAELVDNKYIDPVKDEKGNLCSGHITAEKIAKTKYDYYVCLECGDYYKSSESDCTGHHESKNTYKDSGKYRIELAQYSYTVDQGEEFISPLAKVYYENELVNDKLEGHPKKVNTNTLGEKKISYYDHGQTKEVTVTVVDKKGPSKPQIILRYDNVNGKSYKGNWYSGNIYVEYKSTDYVKKGVAGHGIKHYEVSSNGIDGWTALSGNTETMKAEGNYLRYVRAIDKSGNPSEVNSYRIKIDITKPTCQLEVKSGTKYGDWYNTNTQVGFKTTNGTVSSVKSSSIDYPTITSPVANKKITGTVVDEAGNKNTCSITINVDNRTPAVSPAPTLKITPSDGKASNTWHNSNFRLSFSGADNISGNLYYYNINSPVPVSNGRGTTTQATYVDINYDTAGVTYYAKVCSVSGLCSGDYSYVVKMDRVIPTIVANENPKTLGNEDFDFNWNTTITNCGVSGCFTYCDPQYSRKTGSYSVTCVATSNSNLFGNTVFDVKHSYPAAAGTCWRDTEEEYCADHGDNGCCKWSWDNGCGGGTCTPDQHCVDEQYCCKTGYRPTTKPYTCYSCPYGGSLIGTTCYY